MKARRPAAATVFVLACLAAAGMAGVTLGTVDIPLARILAIIAHALGLGVTPTWEAWEQTIVIDVRLPRVIVGAAVGAGLALCGATLQGLFRNPLASPSVIGVSNGAALGAVISLYLGLAAFSVWILPVLSVVGAMVTIFVVYGIAARHGRVPIGILLLAGVAVATLNAALTAFVISLSLANYEIGKQLVFWLLGGLDGRTWDHVRIAVPGILCGSAVLVTFAKDLDAMVVGEVHALSVGVDVHRVRRILIAVTALVIGVAVSVSGTIGFVGLVIPHMLRLIIGPGHRWLLPLSLLTGAAFLVAADLVARTIIAPEEMRLGVITAAVGAPFFLFLLVRERRDIVL